MKKADVEIGGVYWCKVSGRIVPVHIDRETCFFHPGRITWGWYGTNYKTGRQVGIKSARRLRARLSPTLEKLQLEVFENRP